MAFPPPRSTPSRMDRGPARYAAGAEFAAHKIRQTWVGVGPQNLDPDAPAIHYHVQDHGADPADRFRVWRSRHLDQLPAEWIEVRLAMLLALSLPPIRFARHGWESVPRILTRTRRPSTTMCRIMGPIRLTVSR